MSEQEIEPVSEQEIAEAIANLLTELFRRWGFGEVDE